MSQRRRLVWLGVAVATCSVAGLSYMLRSGYDETSSKPAGSSQTTAASQPSETNKKASTKSNKGSSKTANQASVPAVTSAATDPSSTSTPTIRLTLQTRPSEVNVYLGKERIGSSGEELHFPKSKQTITLRLSKPGYADAQLELLPNQDQSKTLTLKPVGNTPKAPSPSAPAQQPAKGRAPSPRPAPVKAPPKPHVDLGDNPFKQ